MSIKYKMDDEDGIYFLTMTAVEWVDISRDVLNSRGGNNSATNQGNTGQWWDKPPDSLNM